MDQGHDLLASSLSIIPGRSSHDSFKSVIPGSSKSFKNDSSIWPALPVTQVLLCTYPVTDRVTRPLLNLHVLRISKQKESMSPSRGLKAVNWAYKQLI